MALFKKKSPEDFDDTYNDMHNEIENYELNLDSTEDAYEDEYDEVPTKSHAVLKTTLITLGCIVVVLIGAFFAKSMLASKDVDTQPKTEVATTDSHSSITRTPDTDRVRIIGFTRKTGKVCLYDGAGKVLYDESVNESRHNTIEQILQSHEGNNVFYGFDKSTQNVYKLTFDDKELLREKLAKLPQVKEITDVVQTKDGTYYVGANAGGLWKIDSDNNASKLFDGPVNKFDISNEYILYSSGNNISVRPLAGGPEKSIDMKNPTEAIYATKNALFVLNNFGSGCDNALAMFLKPASLGAERIIELKDKGLKIVGRHKNTVFIEQNGSVKEIDIDNQKPLRKFKKDKTTTAIVCVGESVYELDSSNTIRYKTLGKKNADLGDFIFSGGDLYIFGK